MTVATPVQPDSTAQTGTQYKANIDAAVAVMARFGNWFAPHENDAGSPAEPDMTVRLEAGWIWDGASVSTVAAQSTGTIGAPSGNPRIDLVVVDAESGAVSVITGSESASPSAPALTAGKIPVAQVALAVSQTTIENTDITDIRVFPLPEPIEQAEAEAGTGTTPRLWAAQQVAQAIAAQANSNEDSVRLGHAVLAGQAGTVVELFDGLADAFGDASGVDAANSTNEVRQAAGYYLGLSNSDGNALQDSKTGSNAGAALNNSQPYAGIRWTQSGAATVLGAKMDVHAVNSSGNVTAKLYEAGNGTPIATSAAVNVSATGETEFTFSSSVEIADSTDYVLAFETAASGADLTLATVTAPGTDVNVSAVQTSSAIFNISSDQNMDSLEDLRFGLVLGATANLTLTGESYTASAAPSAGTVHVHVMENESITVNTDLLVDMSRDDGTTWETGTLALIKTLSSGVKVYKASAIDLSGQPSGTDIRHRVRTANTKDIEIHAVVSDVV